MSVPVVSRSCHHLKHFPVTDTLAFFNSRPPCTACRLRFPPVACVFSLQPVELGLLLHLAVGRVSHEAPPDWVLASWGLLGVGNLASCLDRCGRFSHLHTPPDCSACSRSRLLSPIEQLAGTVSKPLTLWIALPFKQTMPPPQPALCRGCTKPLARKQTTPTSPNCTRPHTAFFTHLNCTTPQTDYNKQQADALQAGLQFRAHTFAHTTLHYAAQLT